jgi:hypothetical protein
MADSEISAEDQSGGVDHTFKIQRKPSLPADLRLNPRKMKL